MSVRQTGVIEQQVSSCGVLLTIIGKDWLTMTDEKGTFPVTAIRQ